MTPLALATWSAAKANDTFQENDFKYKKASDEKGALILPEAPLPGMYKSTRDTQ